MLRTNKFSLYEQAVQDPETELRFVRRVYQKYRGTKPRVLREDFCASFWNARHWVEMSQSHIAHALDLDPEPLAYGRTHHMAQLSAAEQKRLHVHRMDVRSPKAPKADLIVALNFSWMVFTKRRDLVTYFGNCRRALHSKGVFVLDILGGMECQEPNIQSERHGKFTYYWEQANFDPITHSCRFSIHFKERSRPKQKKVFQYDWRLWSIPEVVDVLREVGFSSAHVYWEGDDGEGGGNGVFRQRGTAESCESWVAYIIACR